MRIHVGGIRSHRRSERKYLDLGLVVESRYVLSVYQSTCREWGLKLESKADGNAELYLRRPPTANEDYRIDRMLIAAAERGVKVNIIVYKEVASILTCE